MEIKKISFILFLVISFQQKIYAQEKLPLISNYLQQQIQKNDWLSSDIAEYRISDNYTDMQTGIQHIYIQQQYHTVIVYNAISVFALKDAVVASFKPGLIPQLERKVNSDQPSLNPLSALDAALKSIDLNFEDKSSIKLIRNDDNLHIYNYSLPVLSDEVIKVQLVYREKDDKVLLAWNVSISLKQEPHWWNIRIDAMNGEFIDKNDYTVECFGNENILENCNEHNFTDEIYASPSPSPAVIAQYNVFPFPVESPNFGSRSILTDPSVAAASPYGWHDTNGSTGPEYTITRGNNVYSYEDADNDNLPGYSPDGTSSLNFNYPFAINPVPTVNKDAALTNLFYSNNFIHDFLYQLGFNEQAGNFQQNNYGKGGAGNDFVKAEGFDGSGTNNANFSTPPDGSSGRMQMYLWTGSTMACTNLYISSASFTGIMNSGTATFTAAGNVTANVILVNDNVGVVTDACSAVTNNISGKIALIDRGSCNFDSKAQAAQNAGAMAVIIANNVSGPAPAMSGTLPISIPVISVSQSDGNILKSALSTGIVSATINTCTTANQIDADFDNVIIIHEFGHGVSNRLTGGPSQSGCLANAEQGGEGWSDWLALIATMKQGDQGADARSVGTYVKGQPSNGAGIRRYPYSTNMSINPQTYGGIAANPEVHAIGEIWCDAIWDMSWLLTDQLGFSSNPSASTAGNNIAIRLVLEGMKLQPCGPGFLDARDAILNADNLIYGNAHRCLIWQAFARRGMGYNASQGSPNVAGDETEGFQLPPFCSPPTQAPVAAFTSDASSIACTGTVHFTDQSVQAFNWKWDFADGSTSVFQNPSHAYSTPGTYNVKLVITNPLGTDSITHIITVTSPFSLTINATPSSVCSGDTVHINAAASGSAYKNYNVSQISYAPLTSSSSTSVTLNDDAMSTAKNIGFTFNFFGNNYTAFYICSNGFITFNASQPASVVYGPLIPSASDPNNFIALAWNDLNPQNAGSSINYFVSGLAPNRKLVVRYNTSHYGGTSYPFNVQCILYETTNIIEIHSTIISDVSNYDADGVTTQGIENADGSYGFTVPGRNSAVFSASNDAYRFTPFTSYSYTINPGNLSGPSQNVVPFSSGKYTVTATDGSGCYVSASSANITVNQCTLSLNLKAFIEGFYIGSRRMQPVLQTAGLSSDSSACDSITVELRDPLSVSTIFKSNKVLLSRSGIANVTYPASLMGKNYYVVIKHRNSIETWSKNAVYFNSSIVNYDFTH